jgi:hypothetical protein
MGRLSAHTRLARSSGTDLPATRGDDHAPSPEDHLTGPDAAGGFDIALIRIAALGFSVAIWVLIVVEIVKVYNA